MAYLAAYLVFTGKGRDGIGGFGGNDKKKNGGKQNDSYEFTDFHKSRL